MDAPKIWRNRATSHSIGYFTANTTGTKAQYPKKIGTFLYYARDVDCTILPALYKLAEQQSSPTKNTEDAITYFLDYASTNPSTIIQAQCITTYY